MVIIPQIPLELDSLGLMAPKRPIKLQLVPRPLGRSWTPEAERPHAPDVPSDLSVIQSTCITRHLGHALAPESIVPLPVCFCHDCKHLHVNNSLSAVYPEVAYWPIRESFIACVSTCMCSWYCGCVQRWELRGLRGMPVSVREHHFVFKGVCVPLHVIFV